MAEGVGPTPAPANDMEEKNMASTQHMRLFESKQNEDMTQRWASVTAKGKTEGDYVSARIYIVLSDDARAEFKKLCKPTKTEGITMVDAEVTESWLKPVATSKGSMMKLFINSFKPWVAKE